MNRPPATPRRLRVRDAARILLKPIERFLRIEAASGIILLFITAVALVWVNSPFAHSYEALWHFPVTLGFGEFVFSNSLHFWINDGLMAIFFLVVGLEIRREMHEGALSRIRQATLPVAAACGGVIAPALIYTAFNLSHEEVIRGWAVPTATDIAFAVGVLTVLGKRVPPALRILLLALAIIDDIVAVLIIALFYSSGVQLVGFAIAAGGILVTLMMQKRIRNAWVYVLPGAVVWFGLLRAGVHPALAGVVLGLMTPVRAMAGRELVAPVVRVENALHPWVAYGIMPLFALANAGVNFGGLSLESASAAGLAAGIYFGLVLGKPIGIVLVALVTCRLGVAALPPGVDLRGLIVMGLLGGIGFTMSIFIAYLAFPDPQLLATAKFAVLAGSCTAGALGLLAGWRLLRPVSQTVADTG